MVRRSKEIGAAPASRVASEFANPSPTLSTTNGSSEGIPKGAASPNTNYCQYLGSLVTALDRVVRIPKLIVESVKLLVIGKTRDHANNYGARITKKAIVMAAFAVAGFARFVYVYKHLFVYVLYSMFGLDTLDDYLNRLIHPSYVNKDGPVIHHVPLAAGVPDGNWASHPQKWRLPADQCPCSVVNEQVSADETKQSVGLMNQSYPYNWAALVTQEGTHEALASYQAGKFDELYELAKGKVKDNRASPAEILAKSTNKYINFNVNVSIDESALVWPGFDPRKAAPDKQRSQEGFTTSFVSNFKSNGTRIYTGIHGVYFNSLSLQCLGAKRWIMFPEREYRRLNLQWNGKAYVPRVLSDTDLYRSLKNVWITKVEPCELMHFPPGWGHIVWTDDGPNIMTAPREIVPSGLNALKVHLWFGILQIMLGHNFGNFNADENYLKLGLRAAKFYAPDPESPIPARVNAAVMGL
jgi:hypothetical protein